MALIEGFPDFAAAAAPSSEDLNLAASKFVDVVGGRPAGTGTAFAPGDVDADNLVAGGAGFVNDQKAEPYSEFGVQFGNHDLNIGSLGGVLKGQVGPLPMDSWLTRVCYRGTSAKNGTITLSLGGIGLAVFEIKDTSLDWEWPVEYMIPAGAVLAAEVTYDPASATTPYFLMLPLKALHAGGPVF